MMQKGREFSEWIYDSGGLVRRVCVGADSEAGQTGNPDPVGLISPARADLRNGLRKPTTEPVRRAENTLD